MGSGVCLVKFKSSRVRMFTGRCGIRFAKSKLSRDDSLVGNVISSSSNSAKQSLSDQEVIA